MKVIKQGKQEITKAQFEEKLGVKIKELVRPKDDNFLKIYAEKGYIVYLRCEDMQALFNLDINVFDEDEIKFEKDKIVLTNKEVLYKGKAKKITGI